MNLGEFIIKIGTQGDTKALDEAIKKMSEAEKKTRRQIKLMQDLAKATSEQEKELIKKNAAQQDELDGLKAVKDEQNALNASMQKNIMTSIKFISAIGATVVALDRMGNSLLKSNQQYITFEKQSGISITRLNRMAGLARLSGMNLSPEQVAGDLQSLQQKFYEFGLGKGTGIFAQMGINPMGMKADQFLPVLRQRLKGETAATKSYILSQLGISQEWLNVLDLSDEKFKDYLKTSKELQLTEKERKQLAEYTYQQQKNNMKWELAKQRLLISVMPMVQKIMDVASNAAVKFSNFLNAHPAWIYVLRDVLIMLTGSTLLKTIGSLTKLLASGAGLSKLLGGLGSIFGIKAATNVAKSSKGLWGGLMGLFGKTGGKGLAKLATQRGVGAAIGLVGKRALALAGPIGMVVSGVWLIADLLRMFFNKEDKEEQDPLPEPAETSTRYAYHNVNSNMTNNFFNNPQPANEAINQLNIVVGRYATYANR